MPLMRQKATMVVPIALASSLCLVGLLGTLPAWSDDWWEKKPPWAKFEEELLERGLQTDSRSLLELVEKGPDPDARIRAAQILGLRKEPESEQVLRRVAHTDDNLVVRDLAWVGLAGLGDTEAVATLREMMQSTEDWDRQLYLAGRLAEVGCVDGYPYVEAAAASVDRFRRIEATVAAGTFAQLTQFADPPGDPLELLLDLARDDDSFVRRSAIVSIGLAIAAGAPPERAIPVLERIALDDPDESIRSQAAHKVIALKAAQARAHMEKREP